MKCPECDGAGHRYLVGSIRSKANCSRCDGIGELSFEVVDMPDGEKSILVSDKRPVLICDRCKAEVGKLTAIEATDNLSPSYRTVVTLMVCDKCLHTPPPRKWTRDRPTVPGWYWLRGPLMQVDVVYVEECCEFWLRDGWEFQGPITPEGEPEED